MTTQAGSMSFFHKKCLGMLSTQPIAKEEVVNDVSRLGVSRLSVLGFRSRAHCNFLSRFHHSGAAFWQLYPGLLRVGRENCLHGWCIT